MNDLRQQLAPSWSPVNIVITVVLFLTWWPLGLAMVAYIILGKNAGLDFGRTLGRSRTGNRIIDSFNAATNSWSASGKGGNTNGVSGSGGTPFEHKTDGDEGR